MHSGETDIWNEVYLLSKLILIPSDHATKNKEPAEI